MLGLFFNLIFEPNFPEMKNIRTERLLLHPLTLLQLEMYLQGPVTLAENLGLDAVELSVEAEFWAEVPDAIERICIPKVREHLDYFEWHTHWVIISPTANRVVGGIGLSGLPDEQGQVMVGYFVDDDFAGQGLATEATLAMVDWVMQNADVQSVAADSLKDGIASQRVLQKAGFVFEKETEEGNLRWRWVR